MIIPKHMSNEESKYVAAVVAEQRNADIANAKLAIAQAQLKNYYGRLAQR